MMPAGVAQSVRAYSPAEVSHYRATGGTTIRIYYGRL
jgi:hypothetical protein